jgi:hypothetical protein
MLKWPQEGPANRPYFAYKIFGSVDAGGVSSSRDLSMEQKSIDEILGLVSGRRIKTTGGSHSSPESGPGLWGRARFGVLGGGGGPGAGQVGARRLVGHQRPASKMWSNGPGCGWSPQGGALI